MRWISSTSSMFSAVIGEPSVALTTESLLLQNWISSRLGAGKGSHVVKCLRSFGRRADGCAVIPRLRQSSVFVV